MKADQLLDLLEHRVLLWDGAMGTYLSTAFGVPAQQCRESLNLTRPDIVREVHRRYARAGATLVETNTFAGNRAKLSRFGLEQQVGEINREAARHAKESVGEGVWVAGAVGPVGTLRRELSLSDDDLTALFSEQIQNLAEGGADLILLETFIDLEEVILALDACRKSSDLPVICQMRPFERGKLGNILNPRTVLRTLERHGALIVGVNCNAPYVVSDAVSTMASLTTLKISAQPNAGTPQEEQGRIEYRAAPQQLAAAAEELVAAGASLIGGCCGTTPEHIAQMAAVIAGRAPASRQRVSAAARAVPVPDLAPRSLPDNPLMNRIVSGCAVTVELRAPKGADATPALDGARFLRDEGVDGFNVTDNSLGNLALSNLALAHLVQRETEVQAVLHVSCRDRNLLTIQSDLLGAAALGIRTVLALTGDPPSGGDNPDASLVPDLSSVDLIHLIVHRLNRGLDYAGNLLAAPTSFHVGGAFSCSGNPKAQATHLMRKVEAGASFCITQPIFVREDLEVLDAALASRPIPALVGLCPLRSYRNALYLNEMVPGISIPAPVLQRLGEARTPEEERTIGLNLALSLLEAIRERAHGLYILPPFGAYAVAAELMRAFRSLC